MEPGKEPRYKLKTCLEHSGYGQPILFDLETGQAYGVADVLPDGRPAIELYEELSQETAGLRLWWLLRPHWILWHVICLLILLVSISILLLILFWPVIWHWIDRNGI